MRLFSRKIIVPVLILMAVAAFFVGREYRVLERASFNWHLLWQDDAAQSIGLGDYRVVIEAQTIAGLDSDASALSFDPDRRSLFTVTNKDSQLVELSLDGRTLRRIELKGFGDSEAVEYISPGVYVITDERRQRLIKVHVDDATTVLDAANAEQLTLGIGSGNNNGYEGLAYDSKGQRLFIGKERLPMQIIEVRGFPYASAETPNVEVSSDSKRNSDLFVRDISSLYFDPRSGHLLALSDESRQIVELDTTGRAVDNVSLNRGSMGLNKTVPQAEGIALDDEGTLYVVSEPNLFYVFKKP